MIVIAKCVGRLANRLMLYGHFIAAAAQHDLTVLNPALREYAHYFPETDRQLVPHWPPRRGLPSVPGTRSLVWGGATLAAGVLHGAQARGRDVGLIRLRRDEHLDLGADAFLDMVRRHRALFVQGWFFRNPVNCARHRDVVRSHLRPHPRYLERADGVLAAARLRRRFVVGVHIRHTDYERYRAGMYFYPHTAYRRLMSDAEASFSDRDVTFVVCSDAPIPRDVFAGLDVIYGAGEPLVDLLTFAGCDRLIGPPSTYTTWASYYGDVPRLMITGADQRVDVASFQVAVGLSQDTAGRAVAETTAWEDPNPRGPSE